MNGLLAAAPPVAPRQSWINQHAGLILLGLLALGLALRLYFASMPGYPGDIDGWSRMSALAVRFGYPHMYDPGIFNRDEGVYPPFYHVMLNAVGLIYRQFVSPTFALGTPELNTLLKLFPIVCEMLLAATLYWGLGKTVDRRAALVAVAAFLLNPAILYTSAYWGMFGDAFYALCVVIALFALQRERLLIAGAALAAGVFFKFQTVAFLPLIGWWLLRPLHWKRLLTFAVGFALATALIWLPYVLAGTLPNALRALRNTVGLFPVLAANAHNVWWLYSGGDVWQSDVQPVLADLSARTVGLLAFGAAHELVLFRSVALPQRFAAAAYIGFAFYMLSTEMHENYLYPTVVLLVIAASAARRYAPLAIVISVTACFNMALHDVLIDPATWLPAGTLDSARMLNATVNGAVFAAWTLSLLWDGARQVCRLVVRNSARTTS